MKIVVEEENNIRIDRFLADNTSFSRSIITKMLKDNYIFVNDKVVKPSYIVQENDIIIIKDGYIQEDNIIAQDIKLNIVYEDDYLIVIDKPSGLVVHPGCGNKDNTLVNALKFYNANFLDDDSLRPGIVHRIDKDTSGLLIVAKDLKTQELLSNMFKEHSIIREYIALVHGILLEETGIIDAPIGRDLQNRKQMAVTSKNSKKAITHFKVLKRYKKYTLLKLRLETGRTHQIRVHMKYINHPIFNDPVYSNDKASDFGQFLHSYSMKFIHPITNEKLEFKSELPKFFQDFLNTLD